MDFSTALDTEIGSVEKPPLVPRGTYIAQVSRLPKNETVGANKNWDKLVFPLKLIAPTDDVDIDDLQAFGDIGNAYVEHVFMFNKEDEAAFKKGLYYAQMFLEQTLEITGVTFREGLAQSIGRELLVTIDWDPNEKNPDDPYVRVKSVAPVN